MRQKLILKEKLTDLNKYINRERTNRIIAAKIKKQETEYVAWEAVAQGLKPHKKPVIISYTWYVSKLNWDASNVAFAKKFVEDGLVLAEVIKDDNLRWVTGFRDHFVISKTRKGVDVEIFDVNNPKNTLKQAG